MNDIKNLLLDHLCSFITLEKAQSLPITILVSNLETNETFTVVKHPMNASRDTYKIIYDPKHSSSPMNYPDNYYCNSLEDLKTIVVFLGSNTDIYKNPSYEDDVLCEDMSLRTSYDDDMEY